MTDSESERAIELEEGRLLFARECQFVAGMADSEAMPPLSLPEVAFAGRSNVGKSSLVNALTGHNTLARVSHTPGRTQQLNFFDLGGRLMLVDMPGYGFAQVAKAKVAAWTRMVNDYLRGRTTLRRTCVLIDARHGLKDNDRAILKMLDQAAVAYQIVLTKADEIKASELAILEARIGLELATHTAAHPEVMSTSSRENQGIAELRAALATLANPREIA